MSSSSAWLFGQNSVLDFLALTQERQWNPNRISESIPHLPIEASGNWDVAGICLKCFIQCYHINKMENVNSCLLDGLVLSVRTKTTLDDAGFQQLIRRCVFFHNAFPSKKQFEPPTIDSSSQRTPGTHTGTSSTRGTVPKAKEKKKAKQSYKKTNCERRHLNSRDSIFQKCQS